MRRKLVLVILTALFGGLGFFIVRRHLGAEAHSSPTQATAEQRGESSTDAAPSEDRRAPATGDTAAAGPRAELDAGSPAADVTQESLDRTLRVASTGWELMAPGVVARSAPGNNDESLYHDDLSVAYDRVDGASGIREALSVGGGDEDGADIGVVSLPTFVAAYEKFRALQPEVFFVTGWSNGREGLATYDEDELNDPNDPDQFTLRGTPGSPSTFAALSMLDFAGLTTDSAEIAMDFDDERPDFGAVARNVDDLADVPDDMELRVTTAEATRLVPFVAIASNGFLRRHPRAVRRWARGWLAGRKALMRDVPRGARKVVEAGDDIEAVEMVDLLGWIEYADLRENVEVTGLSGRGAATLERLFQLTWRIWRESGELSTPAPASLPVSTDTLMALVSENGMPDSDGPGLPESATEPTGDIFLTYRFKEELDRNEFVKDLGLIAGVFSRSHCTISVRNNPDLSEELIEDAVARFGLERERFTADDGVRWPGRAAVDVHRP